MSLLSLVLFTTGCSDNSNNTSSSPTDSTSSSTAEEQIQITQIKDLYTLEDHTEVCVKGVVGQLTYDNSNSPVGIILFDATGTIYIYGKDSATSVKIGNEITVKGSTTHFISQNDSAAAEEAGYTGGFQIEQPTILENDNKINEIPKTGVEVADFATVVKTVARENNITSRTYTSDVKIKWAPGTGYNNVYLYSADGETNTYAYSLCNGKDLEWIRPYDGKFKKVTYTVLNAKCTKGTALWRIIIDEIGEDASLPSDDVMAGYALNHAKKQFQSSYSAAVDIDLKTEDPLLPGATFAYESLSASLVLESNTLKITIPEGGEKAKFKITATYNGKSKSEVIEIVLAFFDESKYQLTSIREARSATEAKEVVIKGQLAQFAYKKNLEGIFLCDEESSMLVYFKSTELSKLQEAVIGSTVYVKGTLAKDNTLFNNYDQLNNAELLHQDYTAKDLPTTFYEESTISELIAISANADENLVGKVYKVEGVFDKTASMYKNVILRDPTDYNKTMMLYSQRSSGGSIPPEYMQYEPYMGKNTSVLVTFQNTNKYNGGAKYRFGCIGVLEEIPLPGEFALQQVTNQLTSSFATTYNKTADVSVKKTEGVTVKMTSSSTSVTDISDAENYKYHIEVTQDENVTLDFEVSKDNIKVAAKVEFAIAPVKKLTVAQAREEALSGRETAIEVEGIVTHVVKNTESTETGYIFYISDETTSLFCYTFGKVEVGDKVKINGKTSLYHGCPQFGRGAVIEVLSHNNVLTPVTETKTIAQLAAMTESEGCGAKFFKTSGTLTYTATAVTLSDGDQTIQFAEYPKNSHEYLYSSLEQYNGKEVSVTLVSYTTNSNTGIYDFYVNQIALA